MSIKDLIQQYEASVEASNALLRKVAAYKDGFIYITIENSWGSHFHRLHNNDYTVRQVVNDYNGDNGNVTIFTNNSHFASTVKNYEGDTFALPLKAMEKYAKDNKMFKLLGILKELNDYSEQPQSTEESKKENE